MASQATLVLVREPYC